jgi:hypothetical protein
MATAKGNNGNKVLSRFTLSRVGANHTTEGVAKKKIDVIS